MGATPRAASTLHPRRPPASHPPSPQQPGAELRPTACVAVPLCPGHRAGVTAPPPPPPPQPLAPRRRQPAFRSEGSVDGRKRARRPRLAASAPHAPPTGEARVPSGAAGPPCPAPHLATNRPASVWGPRERPERASAPSLHGVTVLGPAIRRAAVKSVVALLL